MHTADGSSYKTISCSDRVEPYPQAKDIAVCSPFVCIRLFLCRGADAHQINHPFRKHKQGDTYEDDSEEPDNDYDDDEEGLLYDGD